MQLGRRLPYGKLHKNLVQVVLEVSQVVLDQEG